MSQTAAPAPPRRAGPPWTASLPWSDRAGRFSWFKCAVFAAVLAPALWIAAQAWLGLLGAKATMEAQHQAGDWAIRLLVATLAVTPLRRLLAAPRVATVRRMLGLGSLGYALLHLGLYVAEENFRLGKVAAEIALRVYLAIGFAALLGLVVLGLTSTDGMIRRMGRAWGRLHRIVYGLAALGLLHYFMQSKAGVSAAVLMAGLFLLLMILRAGFALGRPMTRASLLAIAAALAGLATAGLEFAWYALATGIPAARVLAANLRFPELIRPACWVLFAGLAVALLPAAAGLARRLSAAKPMPPAALSIPAGE